LRSIENKSIERIGSNKKIGIDLRLISATHKDLFKNIEKGEFREDLFYRINTIIIEIPPLRERKEDIPAFINFFLNMFKNEMKKNIENIEGELLEILMNYDYPGNIRELKNIIERLVVLSDSNMLSKRDLPIIRVKSNETGRTDLNLRTLKDVRQNAERKHIQQILMNCGNNISEAAKVLDISRRQLYNKIYEYNIEI
jgi:transcriptional regulator with PAS, ATPase and Fis domain